MNIHLAEQATGLTARQIREYEKIGLISAIARRPSGYREFSQASIERLCFIKRAREVDFSLDEIRRLLALQDDPHRDNTQVKALTAEHICMLDKKIAQLQAMKDVLQAWHDSCKGDGTASCSILERLAKPTH